MNQKLEFDIKDFFKNLILMIVYKSIRISELKSRPCYSGSPAYDF